MKLAYTKTAIGFLLTFTVIFYTLQVKSPLIVHLFRNHEDLTETHSTSRSFLYALLYGLIAALVIYYIERAKFHFNMANFSHS